MTQFELLCVLQDASEDGDEWLTATEIRRRAGCKASNLHHKLSKLLVYSHVERRRSKYDSRLWEYRVRTNI